MAGQSQKKKSGNKHFLNPYRSDRKYKRFRVEIGGTRRYSRPEPTPGKCGSRFCSKQTGCEPWK